MSYGCAELSSPNGSAGIIYCTHVMRRTFWNQPRFFHAFMFLSSCCFVKRALAKPIKGSGVVVVLHFALDFLASSDYNTQALLLERIKFIFQPRVFLSAHIHRLVRVHLLTHCNCPVSSISTAAFAPLCLIHVDLHV